MNVYQLNKKYEQNDSNGINTGINNYQIILGNVPILFSASHAVKQYRNESVKAADGMTGGIVEYITKTNDVYGITRTANLNDDPNYYNFGTSLEYKKQIIKLIEENNIKYFFDIHGCSDKNDFVMDIGINGGINISNLKMLEILHNELSKLGNVGVDTKFKASLDGNISRYIHEMTGIDCFQIEINHELRFNKINSLVEVFNNVIKLFKNEIEKNEIKRII